MDYAFALRYPHWPEEAAEWITRERTGLDQVTVDNIVSRGCYLVHKPCSEYHIQHYNTPNSYFSDSSLEIAMIPTIFVWETCKMLGS